MPNFGEPDLGETGSAVEGPTADSRKEGNQQLKNISSGNLPIVQTQDIWDEMDSHSGSGMFSAFSNFGHENAEEVCI